MVQMLNLRGFPVRWCDWVMETMRGVHVGVKVNDEIGPYFKTNKGLGQGDALSLLAFDLAVDSLSVIMEKASQNRFVKGVLGDFFCMGSICLNMLMTPYSCCGMMKIVLETSNLS